MMDDHIDILQRIKDNKSDVTSCDFGGNYLLGIGSSDKSVRILEWKTGLGFVDVSYSPLGHHKYGVTWIRFSPQGTMLASSSVDGTTILWNAKTGTKIYTMVQATKCSVRRCEFTPDSTKLLAVGDDGVVCFWDLVHRNHISRHCLNDDEDASILGVAVSPDSEFLLTGDGNGLMKLWKLSDIDLNCLQPLHVSKNVHDGINSCEFSPDLGITGAEPYNYKYCFATCGVDSFIKLWSMEINRNPKNSSCIRCNVFVMRILSAHESDVLNVRFNLNGSLIASAGLDKTVKLWEVKTGECVKNFVGHTRYVNCCAFSKSSAILASGSNDKTVIIWDLNRSFSLDSELIVKCVTCKHFSGGDSVRLLAEELMINQSENDKNCLKLLQTLNLMSGVNTVHFHGNNIIAAAGGDKSVTIWKRNSEDSTFMLHSILEGHKYSILQVEISPCGKKLISGSVNGIMIIWDLEIGLTYEMRCPDALNSIRTNRFSPDSNLIAAAGDDQLIFLWDAKNLEHVKTLSHHKDAITSVAFTPDSKLLASTCCSGDVKIYSLETTQCYASKDAAHDLGGTCCDFSSRMENAGNEEPVREYVLATCGNDSLIKVWKIRPNKCLEWKELSTHGGNVSYVRFSPTKANLLASCATDCTIRLWNVESADCLHVFDHHGTIVTTCAFSHDSTLLATGSLDKKIMLWTLPAENEFDRTLVVQETKKLFQHWCTSDIAEWFAELGFTDTSRRVLRTSLNGQQLLTLKINDILDVIGVDGEERNGVRLHLYWMRSETKKSSVPPRSLSEAPHQFLCPITHEIMTDPVICSDGFTYERRAITEWLLCGKYTSPMTNESFPGFRFLPNTTLRTNILKYLYGEEVKD